MKDESTYTSAQFIGHVLSTTPLLKASVEEMSDWGIYLGKDDDQSDIDARLSIVSYVLDKAASASEIISDPSVLKVFTMPEFFWRGIKGAYYYSNSNEDKMYNYISTQLVQIINSISVKYSLTDWLFLFGTTLSSNILTACENDIDLTLSQAGDNYLSVYSIIKNTSEGKKLSSLSHLLKMADGRGVTSQNDNDEALSNLLTSVLDMSDNLATKEVYNRCFIYYLNSANKYTVQKEYKSKEDFILNNPSASEGKVDDYLQTMVIYPPIDGVPNPVETIPYSYFQCKDIKIGVEICLDHSRKRLLGYLAEGIIPQLDIQLVISCGMQLKKDSVATVNNGMLFNCDGEYTINVDGQPDAENGDHCHSQLKTASFNPSWGWRLSNYIPAEARIAIDNTGLDKDIYPHGLGEIHIYGPQTIVK